jgi:hypothetical protein
MTGTIIPMRPSSNAGRKNIFVCAACGGHIVTVDLDEGVQPLAISCHATLGCRGLMKSSLYKVFDQSIRAAYEFYRPPAIKILTPAEASTVANGGLLLRFASETPPEGLALTMGLVATVRHLQALASSVPPPPEGEDADPGERECHASRSLAEILLVCNGALAKVPQ